MERGVAALVCTVTLVLSHVMDTNSSRAAQPNSPSPNVKTMAEASNHFAFDLYGKLSGEKGNVFFSPSSISTALDMVYAGAKGETAEQMAGTLRLERSLTDGAVHAAAGQLIRELNAGGEQGVYQLTIANRLWGQKNYKFLDSFLSVVRENYGASLEQLNFSQPQAARATINHWVEQATKEKIKDLIPEGGIAADTRLVLTNAVYFKGTWLDVFLKDSTHPMSFSLSSNEKADVPMMYQKKHHDFAEIKLPNDNGVKILRLPYKSAPGGKGLSMLLALPDNVEGLKDIERQLNASEVQKWINELKPAEVMIWLPKFQLTQSFELKEVLSALGMPLAFDSQAADFSGMGGRKDLFLSKVFHKAFVDVNEEGTEAAAATGASMAPMAMPRREEPKEFKADHPFIFLIRDEASGCILFMGRAADPRG